MSVSILPADMEISHAFFTISQHLTIKSGPKEKLYEVRYPSLRLKKKAYVLSAGESEELVVWLAPVWGVNWNIMVSLPDDQILGVLQKEKESKTGLAVWVARDYRGHQLLTVKPVGSLMNRLRKKITLFSSREDRIFVDQQMIGSFTTHSGYIHERYSVHLESPAEKLVDPRMLLSAIVTLTGIFARVFT